MSPAELVIMVCVGVPRLRLTVDTWAAVAAFPTPPAAPTAAFGLTLAATGAVGLTWGCGGGAFGLDGAITGAATLETVRITREIILPIDISP